MTKKLLFIPQDYRLLPHAVWFEAFCEHFDAMYFTDLESGIKFNPDYVFLQSMAIHPDILRRLPGIKIQWTGDCRLDPLPEVINTPADITFLASAIGQQHLYPGAKYLQHAAHDFRPVKEDATGIVFIGNNYDQFPGAKERSELCWILKKMYSQFYVFGSGFPIYDYRCMGVLPYNKVGEEYNKAYISISSSIYNDIEGYWSNRPLDIMAAGSLCLMRYSPNLEKYFEDGVHCVFYRSNEEAIVLIDHLLSNPDLRNSIAKAGQAEVFLKHTYSARVRQIMEVLCEY